MGMEQALIVVIVSLACGLFAGAIGSMFWVFGLRRWLLRLEISINDLQERALSVKGKNAASKRWEEEKWMEEAVKAKVVSPERYDNDPRG